MVVFLVVKYDWQKSQSCGRTTSISGVLNAYHNEQDAQDECDNLNIEAGENRGKFRFYVQPVPVL